MRRVMKIIIKNFIGTKMTMSPNLRRLILILLIFLEMVSVKKRVITCEYCIRINVVAEKFSNSSFPNVPRSYDFMP